MYVYLFYKYDVYINICAQCKYKCTNNIISTYISNTIAITGAFNMFFVSNSLMESFLKQQKILIHYELVSVGKNSVPMLLQILLIILLVRNSFF